MPPDADIPVQESLTSPFVLEYVYKRSLGPILSRFFTSLQQARIEGIRTPNGRVLCPPSEYDPESGEPLSEFVPVSSCGVVLTWAWVHAPRSAHPLSHPFAWALIRLDGADTAFVHAVDAQHEHKMTQGLRVRARFRPQSERQGGIRDIECFDLETSGAPHE
jgi:uncharacterized OB-fold protein